MVSDGKCPLCGEWTNGLAADPGKWPLRFCPPGAEGETVAHHVRCVTERVYPETHGSTERAVEREKCLKRHCATHGPWNCATDGHCGCHRRDERECCLCGAPTRESGQRNKD